MAKYIYIFEHRKLTKTFKIGHFERGISEQFPNAYDGIYMNLLNFELFISKALAFSYIFFNLYVFIVIQDLGPGLTKSKFRVQLNPNLRIH